MSGGLELPGAAPGAAAVSRAPLPRLQRPRSFGFLRNLLRFLRELREAVVQAFGSLLAHRLRAALTVSGISIGVGTVIAIYSAIAGLDESFARQLSALGPHTLFVSKWSWGVNVDNWWKFRNRPLITRTDFRAIESMARLPESVAAFTTTQATIAQGERELRSIDVRGTTGAFLETGGWQVKRGRFLSAIDEELGTDACVIGADLEEAFFKGSDALGGKLRVGPLARCTVVGTLVRRGISFGRSEDAILMLPLASFGRAFGTRRSLVVAVVAPRDRVFETEAELQAVVRQSRRLAPDQEDNFSVNRQDKILQGFTQVTLALRVVAGLVGLITLFVGGIGIMNILLVSVKERTREIGVRRALGARRSTILLQFLAEAVAVSLVGGLLGTLLGIFVAWFLAQVTPMAAAVSLELIALGAGFSLGTGLLFGIWPAWSAAMLHPIEALRYE